MVIRRILGTVLLLIAAGCALSDNESASAPTEQPSVASSHHSRPSASGGDDDMTHGIAVYWPDNPDDTTSTVRNKARRILDYVVSLGGDAVSLSFPFATDSATGNRVHSLAETPSPERVATVVKAARRRNLTVTLRPLLDEENLSTWRGDIHPSDPASWFRSYRDWLTPYLKLAQRTGVDRVVLAVELNSLEDSPQWKTVLDDARSRYDGTLTVSRNWDAFDDGPLPFAADETGLDAYFRTTLDDSASQQKVHEAWESFFGNVDRSVKYHQLVLSEVGISAQDGAYREPYRFSDADVPENTLVQRRWFTAACRFAKEHGVAGIYYWKLSFHANPDDPSDTNSDRGTFLGRPAADTIRSCFTS